MPKVEKQTMKKPKKSNEVLDRLSDVVFDEDEGIKLSVYGRSGSGKTTFWSTFPGPICAMICSGQGELRSVSMADRKKIKTIKLQEPEDLLELVDNQVALGFRTMVLDHATGYQDLILAKLLGLDEIPEQKSWGLATQQEYGIVSNQFKTNVRKLLDLKCNVVCIAQEREFNTDNDSDIIMPYVGSALSPSIKGWLDYSCDYVVETFIQEEVVTKTSKIQGKEVVNKKKTGGVEYCLRTAPDPVYTTKFRVPKGGELPKYIVDPDYDKLMKLINGG